MFNQRLRLLREESNMTQKEVAEKIVISPRVYAYYEMERFPKDAETIKKLAFLFNCTTDYLLGTSDFKNHEDAQIISDSADIIKQIKDPHILESAKGIFNALADISKNAGQQGSTYAHCLDVMINSICEISSSYDSSVEKAEDYIKFLEFKTFSLEKVDSVNESIKTMANELANKIKVNLEQGDNVNLIE